MKRLLTVISLIPVLITSAAQALPAPKPAPKVLAAPTTEPAKPPASTSTLDFDLLPPASAETLSVPTVPPEIAAGIKRRRFMLTLHQTVGMALAVGMTGTMITGQLNYNDKFLGGNSGRFQGIHQAFAYPTLSLAAVTAGLAIFAPVPIDKESGGFDRMTLHKIGMFTAFAGWTTELILGLLTAAHEGFASQRGFATAHLAVGYTTLAGVLLGTGAIAF